MEQEREVGMEIGSIYEVAPAVTGKRVEAETLCLNHVEKYGKKHKSYTASGREAIELALISLERERPDVPKRCLMPAYMCDSVFAPFRHRGWELIFYAVDSGLESTGETLFQMILETNPGLVFVHPYYGEDTFSDLRAQLPVFRKSGILVMEDVTQSYYLEAAGQEADFVVGSLRKWYPVPDGGFVVSDLPLAEDVLQDGEAYAEERLEPLVQKWEYLQGAEVLPEKKELFLRKNRSLEEALDRYEGVRRMSGVSAAILSETDEEAARHKRAENQSFLYEKMIGMKRLRPVLVMQGVEAPLYLPIYAKEREDLQRFLTEHDIYAPVLWPFSEDAPDFFEGDEDYIYEHLLALPIDQRYGIREMERIAQVLSAYEEQTVIGIRADANDTVATGHIMRCITIARQLRKKGCRVLFFTADEGAQKMLSEAGMEQVCLHTQWNQMEKEIPRLKRMLSLAGIQTLLVDSYQVTPAYFEELRDVAKLIWIDDCFDVVCPVDVLINYNAYHARFPYKETYGDKTKLLLGPDYVPLREEFGRETRSASRPEDGTFSVLLSSGGGDAQDALLGILQRAVETEGLEKVVFHTVVGGRHPRERELVSFAEEHPNVKLYRPCRDMAGLMAECDGAVSAAGTMLFELSAMQVPTVFFVTADNQRYDKDFFAEQGRMLYAGDIRQDREACVEAVCDGIRKMITDVSLRECMKEKLSEVTDGRGAERIADEIYMCMKD
ncbi:MAG: UDP-2,4-diacetamido-2,4,6-trideoxy-beta-L-altropyranose hydrolase [Lachnospiraceae bacterium]|nr:UDP-2,4-diacetamido-2,4,6-trideoxy-beta-L-altropyranose hydrolase [Lachnospiraceae bacterium]